MSWRNFSAPEIVEMPTNELAVLVLEDWVQSRQWNLWNFVNSTHDLPRGAQEALSEAQTWLLNHGCLARDPQQTSSEAAFVTRVGHTLLEHGDQPLKAAARLNLDLHPRLKKVQTQFLLGEYELAAFAAMREVEIEVRDLSKADASLVGTKLMTFAFREDGPLRDDKLDGGEQVGIMNLFQGAIGVFKNPPSHRQIDYDDPTEASEVVLFADLLMRLLDRYRNHLEALEP
jgi:uncharacterized protein (TIGR02391 family)